MPKLNIDGVEIEFSPGEKIIEAAKRAKNEIPHYCYHTGLSVVAQCRMCLVEVEGQKKLVTACSTPCGEGMKVKTNSDRVKKSVAGVQEFLLANHPLDCPICDQAGECSLQENSFKHGESDTRFDFFRRTFIDVDMGPSIKKNMNRCIHCTRCIRYCDEVGKIHEMVALQRGNSTEIVTIDDKPLQTAYAGGLADVCPVGSLTTKDFRFKKRVWYLKSGDSICDGCSQGCNITASHENGVLFRQEPRVNMEINKWWMCDEGRYGFHHVQSPSRIMGPNELSGEDKKCVEWGYAISSLKSKLGSSAKVGILLAADITNEEAKLIQQHFPKAGIFSFAGPVEKTSEDEAIDHLLRRKDKSPNLKGLESLGIGAYSGFDPRVYDLCIFVSAGKVRIPFGLAKFAKYSVGIGVFLKEEVTGFSLILPGLATLEKSGSFTNHQGKTQSFKSVIPPSGFAKPLDKILELLFSSERKLA